MYKQYKTTHLHAQKSGAATYRLIIAKLIIVDSSLINKYMLVLYYEIHELCIASRKCCLLINCKYYYNFM